MRERPRPNGLEREGVCCAALDCIGEKGVAGATASEIAGRCDLSWGVIPYHFGDRVGLFLALLESGATSLGDALSGLETTTADLADRITSLVDGTGSLMRRDDFRVMLEIQLQLGRDASHRARVRKHTRQLRTQLQEIWRKALPECDPEQIVLAERLATMALRGLALERAVEGGRGSYAAERAAIVASLLPILELDGA